MLELWLTESQSTALELPMRQNPWQKKAQKSVFLTSAMVILMNIKFKNHQSTNEDEFRVEITMASEAV